MSYTLESLGRKIAWEGIDYLLEEVSPDSVPDEISSDLRKCQKYYWNLLDILSEYIEE